MPDNQPPPVPPKLRWLPGVVILILTLGILWGIRAQDDWPFQKRNLTSYQVVVLGGMALIIWWTFLSRAQTRLRLGVTLTMVGLGVLCIALFRLRGMSGDMVPIIEFRWANRALPMPASVPKPVATNAVALTHADFPQYRGMNRDGVLAGPKLETNWTAHPPQVLWRHEVGAGWSGFAVVGNWAVTQEQHGDEERVVAYDLMTGAERWRHADNVRYNTTIAGDGPRATPTIVSNRVYTLGGTGLLNCFELETGKRLWSCDVVALDGGKLPPWGCAGSPLVVDDLVVTHGGENAKHSLVSFHVSDGKPAWLGGVTGPSYSSPVFATLAGTRQLLAFNDGTVSGINPETGATLWEKPWGNGNVVCAAPLVISSNQVLFSSGYGVGAELLEIVPTTSGKLMAKSVWKSIRMKAKFAHMYARAGHLYGLDDGVLACVDLRDGSQRWKEGRYGHGQGLVVGEYYLLMSEPGELILLHPTPEAPNEITRFRVFDSKTWNPPALVGDLLLVRNDREAACLRLAVSP